MVKTRALIISAAIIGFLSTLTLSQNYLSNISATKNDPIFTTYAAPLSRSEYIVDEGYQFKFYDEKNGINFETDNAGHLCLAFKLNGEVRYLLNQMYAQPIITTSYSDLVKYYYQPFEGIDIGVFFQVYSSRIAIQDISITNNTNSPVILDVYPFFHNPGAISEVGISQSGRIFAFRHEEHPDGWTLSHGVPYSNDLADVYLINEVPDAYGAYIEIGSLEENTKAQKTKGENYCVEWGTVQHADGSLCYHLPPYAQQIILHNGSVDEILTEEAPKWGDPDPNISGNGYQGCELGNFKNNAIAVGDSFTIIFTCTATGQQGIATGFITQLPAPVGIRTDIQMSEGTFSPIPQNVDVHFSQYFTSAVISWDYVPGNLYSIYRRTRSTPGRYDLIADSITLGGYLDIGLNPDSTYGYIVIARDSSGQFSGHSQESGSIYSSYDNFFSDIYNQKLKKVIPADNNKVVAFQKTLSLEPNESKTLRIIRGVTEAESSLDSLILGCENLMTYNMEQAIMDDEEIYSRIPRLEFTDSDIEMMYWSAFSMIRQCMLPPEGECSYNYYVFSREPTWGWGHGGQVFHESIVMLAYVYMDPLSAMNSQRVFMERQWEDGYINYRTGPYLNETIPYGNQYTTSAPWFNWENWEIFRISKDTLFLKEAYLSGKKFYQYWLDNRDADRDGLCEWGAHAVLECVRDGQVAVWDQVGWPANFECLDLNVMLVNEAKSLAEMAQELGYTDEYQYWTGEAANRTDSINECMWDTETEFYYHVDKNDHDFTFNTLNDLKRKEIIGFLPLWAGVCDDQQAAKLVNHLKNTSEFWRSYGIPSLSASDSYYNPTGYWNGPVWVQWQYLIFRGLLQYGYVSEARQLAEKVFKNVINQLKINHCFWELYSPDANFGGWHKSYIWTGIVARILIDLNDLSLEVKKSDKTAIPGQFELNQNHPNPFNPITTISFQLPRASNVELKIYNLTGQLEETLVNEKKDAGYYSIQWDATQYSSGVYIYRIQVEDPARGGTDGFSAVKKCILMK
ncbi:T9SS type A sorting domain-containing protein [bacterium]|nr:T9SS type A sorting domain-containing protein [bacterium]